MMPFFFISLFLGLFGLVLLIWPNFGHAMDVHTAEMRGLKKDAFQQYPTEGRRMMLRIIGIIAIIVAQQRTESQETFLSILEQY